jgi:hypothetical protein
MDSSKTTAKPSRNDPFEGGETVTPGTPFSQESTGIFVGTGGDVTVKMKDGSVLSYKNLPDAFTIDAVATEVTAVANGAADILALW